VQFYQKRRVDKMKNRLKNYALWISISSFVFMIIQNSGLQITPESWDLYINSILGILILLGIINNPTTNNKGFGDD
jgi:uncharacterized membrane protein